MSRVTCYACRKKYDYEEDGFCPRCGAFNLRNRGSYTVAAGGDIVRVDGINEAAHKESFLHAEYHAEEKARKILGLDRDPSAQTVRVSGSAGKPAKKKQKNAGVGVGITIVWLMVMLFALFTMLMELM